MLKVLTNTFKCAIILENVTLLSVHTLPVTKSAIKRGQTCEYRGKEAFTGEEP